MQHDFILEDPKHLGVGFDLCTFGFEISFDVLHNKKSLFNHDALILMPLSNEESCLE
jgi:hypothetical protein